MKHLYITKKAKLILATVFAIAFFLPYGVGTRLLFVTITLLALSVTKIAIDVYRSIVHSQRHIEAMERKREIENRKNIIATCNYISEHL